MSMLLWWWPNFFFLCRRLGRVVRLDAVDEVLVMLDWLEFGLDCDSQESLRRRSLGEKRRRAMGATAHHCHADSMANTQEGNSTCLRSTLSTRLTLSSHLIYHFDISTFRRRETEKENGLVKSFWHLFSFVFPSLLRSAEVVVWDQRYYPT